MKNIVICGYYGFQNSGDEALLKSMIEMFRRKYKEIHITVLSKQPELTMRQYQVDAVNRYNLFKINRIFKHADLFVFGGGSLIQDNTSSRSLYYYLTILKMAQNKRVRTMLYGNGIGPLHIEWNKKKASECLNEVDIITLRDEQSGKLLAINGVNKPEILVTADPVFSLELNHLPESEKLLSESEMPFNEKYAVISVRPWKNADERFEEKLARVCDVLNLRYGITPLFIPMQHAKDAAISKNVMSKMQTKSYIVDRNLSVDEIFSVVQGAIMTIGMRLHMLIYSSICNVPVFALSYDPKVREFMQTIDQPFCMDVENIDSETFLEKLNDLFISLPERRSEIAVQLDEMRRRAEQNAKLAIELLERE